MLDQLPIVISNNMEVEPNNNLANRTIQISKLEYYFLKKNNLLDEYAKRYLENEKQIKPLKKNIKITKLSKILTEDLNSKDKISEKYWNSYSELISNKLLHHQIDSQDPNQEIIYPDGSSVTLSGDSWYFKAHNMKILTKNVSKTAVKMIPSLELDTTIEVATQITRKVRIYPNPDQKKMLDKCFNAHRYFYNKSIEELTKIYEENIKIKEYNKGKEEDEKLKLNSSSFISVRNTVIINNEDLTTENKWMEEIPYDTRQLAVKVAIAAKDAAMSNFRNGNISHFKMGFLSKKRSNNVCYITKGALSNGNIFPTKLDKSASLLCKKCVKYRNDHKDDYKDANCDECIPSCDKCLIRISENKKPRKDCGTCHKKCKAYKNQANEICHPKCKRECKVLNKSHGDFSIIQGKDKRYYACIVVLPTDKILETKQNICALDPGVRTFQTMYSQDSIGEFGYNTSKILYNLYRREDKIKSALSADTTIRAKKRYKLKKRCALLRTKIKRITDDLHWKTADYLTKNYQVILLPIFNSKQMANRKNRKISKTSSRLMLGLSHYDFQQKLLYKAKQRGRNVILCKEHYTTKCCGSCGTLNETIGSKKIFQCEDCHLTMDRDTHAARNILIRALSIYFGTLSDLN